MVLRKAAFVDIIIPNFWGYVDDNLFQAYVEGNWKVHAKKYSL